MVVITKETFLLEARNADHYLGGVTLTFLIEDGRIIEASIGPVNISGYEAQELLDAITAPKG